jgi:hypothetical protein
MRSQAEWGEEGKVRVRVPVASAVFTTCTALYPDPDSLALHGVLPAEVAEELGVLRHLLLLHHLTEGRSVAGAVLADDPWESLGEREVGESVSRGVSMSNGKREVFEPFSHSMPQT